MFTIDWSSFLQVIHVDFTAIWFAYVIHDLARFQSPIGQHHDIQLTTFLISEIDGTV